MINDLSRTKYLKSQSVTLIQTPLVDVAPLLYIGNAPQKCEESQQDLPIYQTSKKVKVGKMKLGKGAPMHVRLLSNLQQSTINIRQVCKMVGVCIDIKLFKELMQILTGNSQRQTRCTNPLGALPASNPTDYIQLPRDIHEM